MDTYVFKFLSAIYVRRQFEEALLELAPSDKALKELHELQRKIDYLKNDLGLEVTAYETFYSSYKYLLNSVAHACFDGLSPIFIHPLYKVLEARKEVENFHYHG